MPSKPKPRKRRMRQGSRSSSFRLSFFPAFASDADSLNTPSFSQAFAVMRALYTRSGGFLLQQISHTVSRGFRLAPVYAGSLALGSSSSSLSSSKRLVSRTTGSSDQTENFDQVLASLLCVLPFSSASDDLPDDLADGLADCLPEFFLLPRVLEPLGTLNLAISYTDPALLLLTTLTGASGMSGKSSSARPRALCRIQWLYSASLLPNSCRRSDNSSITWLRLPFGIAVNFKGAPPRRAGVATG
mmetsp:Transcript_85739/g.239731  ORF Transcript_85739/g.239731 Transcript_85739/m.239731 type:complete len:244 (+) Transcript_85739:2101-2832(+)